MNDRDFIKTEELQNEELLPIRKKYFAMDEVSQLVLRYFETQGGVRRDVLEFLSENSFKEANYFKKCKTLIDEEAGKEWFKLAINIINEKEKTTVSFFLNELVAAFSAGIDVEKVDQYYSVCNTAYQMKKARMECSQELETNDEATNGLKKVIEEVNQVVEKIGKDSAVNQDIYQQIEESVNQNNEKVKELQDLIKAQNTDLERTKKELTYYKEQYANSREELSRINQDLIHFKFETKRLQNESKKKDDYEKIENEDAVNVLITLIKTMQKQMDQIKDELKQQREISAERANDSEIKETQESVEKELKAISDKEESTFTNDIVPEEQNTNTVSSDENDKVNRDPYWEKSDNPIAKTFRNIEKKIKDKMEVEEKEYLPDGVQVTKRKNEDIKEKQIIFYSQFKKKQERKKFAKLDPQKQKESIISSMLQKGFTKEMIQCVKSAINEKYVGFEFIYEIVNETKDLETLRSALLEMTPNYAENNAG